MFTINSDKFNINLCMPATQTTAAFVAAKVLGSLGRHIVSDQTVVLVTSTAAAVASLANNFFKNAYAYYAALPVGVGVGVVVHNFFYSNIALKNVLDVKGFLFIAASLAAVKFIADNLSALKKGGAKDDSGASASTTPVKDIDLPPVAQG